MTAPSRRILFVDDDPQLLSGFAKALRKHRDRWAMVFAGSGEAALAELGRGAFDVVVSDMRMPGMDGADLLAQVRDADPSTVRMILSGFSDRAAIVRALPVAHQFFNKPCDLSQLAASIDRACELRALFAGDALVQTVGRLGALPPAPAIYHQLAAQLATAELSLPEITGAVERDDRLGGQVLRLARALVAETLAMASLADVTANLGSEMVVGFALVAHALVPAGSRALPERDIAELQHRALQLARAARRLAASPEVAADVFIAGLVHDVGRIVIAAALPEVHAELGCRLSEPCAVASARERAVLGTSHAEIGAYLLGRWGMPLPVVDAVAYHNDDTTTTPLLQTLRAASAAIPARVI